VLQAHFADANEAEFALNNQFFDQLELMLLSRPDLPARSETRFSPTD
jgi:hypothetical protein